MFALTHRRQVYRFPPRGIGFICGNGRGTAFQCPLLGVKRTFSRSLAMSAFDPKRTSANEPYQPMRRNEAGEFFIGQTSAESELISPLGSTGHAFMVRVIV